MGAAIIEAQAKLRMHRNRALKAFHDANDVRRLAPNGHEISDANAPICCFETGLEDHCIAKIATRFSFDLACGAHAPAAMLLIAEQGSEAGIGIKAGKAQPFYGAIHRTEERRAGKECVRKCKFRWSQ